MLKKVCHFVGQLLGVYDHFFDQVERFRLFKSKFQQVVRLNLVACKNPKT